MINFVGYNSNVLNYYKKAYLYLQPSIFESQGIAVVEAMAPGAIASHVARRFGVSTGQFYTWRKAMLLRSAACGGQQALAKADFAEVQLSAPRHGWPGGAGAAGVWSGPVLRRGLSVSRQARSADQMRLA